MENLINNYLNEIDWQVKENANMGYSLQGMNSYLSNELTKQYWLNNIYTEDVQQAHTKGDLHIHDLNSLSVYCVGWDLMDLLKKGFTGVQGKAASSPPKHLSSALGQIVNFLYTLQGEAAGAQAFSNIDTLLAPFIRYDNLDEKQVRQLLQEFIFNLNVPTRTGFQSPFTNITLDLTPSVLHKDQPVIIGGQPQDTVYGDFQYEMDMFNRLFCEVMLEGDSSGRMFSFPIPTYNVTEDLDWDNPNLKSLWNMTAKYGVPYFSNFIGSDMSPEDARSMCCRLRLDQRQLSKRGGGLFGANALTGSVGVVTINMVRLAHKSKNKQQFFKDLKSLMILAKESLEVKRQVIEDLTNKNLYPYSKFYLEDTHNRFGKYWSNHFSTIGLIGMNEACEKMAGKGIDSLGGKQFAEATLDFMNQVLLDFQEETGNLYNLEATPAEGTSRRLASLDHKDGITDLTYYSNSTQLPARTTDDIFFALDHQESLQSKYTGGTVFHIYLGEALDDGSQVKHLIKQLCTSYTLPYLTVSPTFSVCTEHGYLHGEQLSCPHCGTETEVYSRIVGYYRPIKNWNDAKLQEFDERKEYVLASA